MGSRGTGVAARRTITIFTFAGRRRTAVSPATTIDRAARAFHSNPCRHPTLPRARHRNLHRASCFPLPHRARARRRSAPRDRAPSERDGVRTRRAGASAGNPAGTECRRGTSPCSGNAVRILPRFEPTDARGSSRRKARRARRLERARMARRPARAGVRASRVREACGPTPFLCPDDRDGDHGRMLFENAERTRTIVAARSGVPMSRFQRLRLPLLAPHVGSSRNSSSSPGR